MRLQLTHMRIASVKYLESLEVYLDCANDAVNHVSLSVDSILNIYYQHCFCQRCCEYSFCLSIHILLPLFALHLATCAHKFQCNKLSVMYPVPTRKFCIMNPGSLNINVKNIKIFYVFRTLCVTVKSCIQMKNNFIRVIYTKNINIFF